MNDRLKRLSTKLVKQFPVKEFNDPQETYTMFSDIYIEHKDFYKTFNPEDIIKLVIYIYSYKNTKDFDYGDKILNNLAFSDLLLITEKEHIATCNECNGNGGWECESCGGGGEVDCDTCEGDGTVSCETCNGYGTVEKNGEEVDCDECYGIGEVTCDGCAGQRSFQCDTCKGTGNETCDYCEGDGEYISDESEYDLYTIACWDKDMNDACEQSEGTPYGAFTYDYFLNRFERYIILNIENNHERLNDDLEMDKMYATSYDDNPRLFISGQKTLKIFNMDNSLTSRYIS